MPAQAHERFELRVSAREVVVQYDITGATDENAALSADNLPQAGATRRGLIAEDPEVEREGPANSQLWRGTVRFVAPDFGSGGTNSPTTTGKPRFEWGDGVRLVPSYIARNGVTIANGAGDPFDPPGQQELYFETLTVTALVNEFDYETLKTYRGAINSDVLQLWQPGAIDFRSVKIGTMKCLSIVPASYDVETTGTARSAALQQTLEVQAKFEIMEFYPFLADTTAERNVDTSPWQEWRENVGFRGWYRADGATTGTADSVGDFVDTRGETVTTPVRLTDTGKPIDTRFKVTDAKKTALSTPEPAKIKGYFAYYQRDAQLNVKSCYLVYQRCHALSFVDLGAKLFPPEITSGSGAVIWS